MKNSTPLVLQLHRLVIGSSAYIKITSRLIYSIMTTYMYRGQRPFVWLGRAEIEIHAHVLRLVRPWKQFGFLLLALLPPAWPPKTRVHKLSLHPINNTNIARIIANYDHTNLGARQKLSTQQQ